MITYKLLSKEGDRVPNEDSVGMHEKNGIYYFVLADGLGGHGKGEVASSLAVEQSIMKFEENPEAATLLQDSFEQAQATIISRQRSDRSCSDMKTTLVALRIQEQQACWAHIGDSRLYHFEKSKFKERTLDHSVPQMLVASKQIKEKEIRHHPDRNRLLRVMGNEWDEPRYEISSPICMKENRRHAFLLCTDGFWELIEEKQMEKCLKLAITPEEWLDRMEQIVLQNGQDIEMDNYSAIAVFIE